MPQLWEFNPMPKVCFTKQLKFASYCLRRLSCLLHLDFYFGPPWHLTKSWNHFGYGYYVWFLCYPPPSPGKIPILCQSIPPWLDCGSFHDVRCFHTAIDVLKLRNYGSELNTAPLKQSFFPHKQETKSV